MAGDDAMTLFVLASILAQIVHVGPAPVPLLRAMAEEVAADENPIYGSRERELAILVTTAEHESGMRMGAHKHDARAWCSLQVHGPESLAHDERACVRAALGVLHAAARTCDMPTASYLSGRCDRARRQATRRESEADFALELASYRSFGLVQDAAEGAERPE